MKRNAKINVRINSETKEKVEEILTADNSNMADYVRWSINGLVDSRNKEINPSFDNKKNSLIFGNAGSGKSYFGIRDILLNSKDNFIISLFDRRLYDEFSNKFGNIEVINLTDADKSTVSFNFLDYIENDSDMEFIVNHIIEDEFEFEYKIIKDYLIKVIKKSSEDKTYKKIYEYLNVILESDEILEEYKPIIKKVLPRIVDVFKDVQKFNNEKPKLDFKNFIYGKSNLFIFSERPKDNILVRKLIIEAGLSAFSYQNGKSEFYTNIIVDEAHVLGYLYNLETFLNRTHIKNASIHIATQSLYYFYKKCYLDFEVYFLMGNLHYFDKSELFELIYRTNQEQAFYLLAYLYSRELKIDKFRSFVEYIVIDVDERGIGVFKKE